jgi:triosephosphate isomerase
MATTERRPLISGNWKMNLDHLEAIHAVRNLHLRMSEADVANLDVSIHPPFTDLRSVQTLLEADSVPVALGAQDTAIEDSGAFTGEVSSKMLARLHVTYVIVGHSERRRYFHEDNGMVAAKYRAVLRNGMVPILCVGETLEEREAGHTHALLAEQVEATLKGLAAEVVAQGVIAYEPIWAIGTGEAATPEDAQRAAVEIRATVERMVGEEAARQVRIQYGGSVTGENAEELLSCADVDGALVGGASLQAESFLAIIQAAARPYR